MHWTLHCPCIMNTLIKKVKEVRGCPQKKIKLWPVENFQLSGKCLSCQNDSWDSSGKQSGQKLTWGMQIFLSHKFVALCRMHHSLPLLHSRKFTQLNFVNTAKIILQRVYFESFLHVHKRTTSSPDEFSMWNSSVYKSSFLQEFEVWLCIKTSRTSVQHAGMPLTCKSKRVNRLPNANHFLVFPRQCRSGVCLWPFTSFLYQKSYSWTNQRVVSYNLVSCNKSFFLNVLGNCL